METALNARDVMIIDVPTTMVDAPVADVIAVLESHDLGGIPVLDNDQKLIGMVTEYDIISKRGLTTGSMRSPNIGTASCGSFVPRLT